MLEGCQRKIEMNMQSHGQLSAIVVQLADDNFRPERRAARW